MGVDFFFRAMRGDPQHPESTSTVPSWAAQPPDRMGLEEQTKAHALLAKAANHPDSWVASHALDELMRRLLVLYRLLEAEERMASPGASKR